MRRNLTWATQRVKPRRRVRLGPQPRRRSKRGRRNREEDRHARRNRDRFDCSGARWPPRAREEETARAKEDTRARDDENRSAGTEAARETVTTVLLAAAKRMAPRGETSRR